MNILGIDPGSHNCGYAIIEVKSEVEKSPSHEGTGVKGASLKNAGVKGGIELKEAGIIRIESTNLQEQILEFIEGIDMVLEAFHIDEVAIESIFYAYNPKSVIKLAQFRGAIALKVLLEIGNFAEYTPLQVKRALTGNGKASKEQVSYMVRQYLGIKNEIKPLDITDAIAIAITHYQRLLSR